MIAGFQAPSGGRILIAEPRRHPCAGEPARHRLRVPELCPVPASDDFRQRRLRAAGAQQVHRRNRAGRRRGAGAGRTGRIRRAAAERIVRRPAAARRAGPRHRHSPPRPAVRRAAFQPGCETRVSMRGEIRRLQQALKITTVYVTHDQEEAMAISDRIAVMEAGRIVQLDSAEALYRRPASAFVAGFIGRANLLHAIVESVNAGRRDPRRRRPETHRAAQGAPAAGNPVSVVIRPESIAIVSTDTGLTGVVQSRTYLGDKIEYEVSLWRADAEHRALQSGGGRRPSARNHRFDQHSPGRCPARRLIA